MYNFKGLVLSLLVLSLSCAVMADEPVRSGESGSDSPRWIPTDDLPNQTLVTNFKQLAALGVINHDMQMKDGRIPWASSYFPAWAGGAAGRWQRDAFYRAMKTIFGPGSYQRRQVAHRLFESTQGESLARNFVNDLSPTEKYDILVGDFKFTSSKVEETLRGHRSGGEDGGKIPEMWAGYCNGISAASIHHEEPFRRVDVITFDGFRYSLYPNDVKALLAVAYYNVDDYFRLGERCTSRASRSSLRDAACQDVNPGSFLLALTNRMGIARSSFVIDVNRFNSVSNHPIARSKVRTMSDFYPVERTSSVAASAQAKYLIDVEFDIEIASTSDLLYHGHQRDEERGNGHYERVGFKGKVKTYAATVELDQDYNVVGGEWKGSYRESPDFVWFGKKPYLVDEKYTRNIYTYHREQLRKELAEYAKLYCGEGDDCDTVKVNPALRWNVIKRIYDLSISNEPKVPVLDLRQERLRLPPHSKQLFTINAEKDVQMTLMYFYRETAMGLFAYVQGSGAAKVGKVKLFASYDGREHEVDELNLADLEFSLGEGRRYLYFSREIFLKRYTHLRVAFFERGQERREIGSQRWAIKDIDIYNN